MRHLTPLVLCLVSAAGCKGETVIKPDPQTQTALDQCNKDKASLTDYKKQLEQSNIDLQNKQGSAAEIVVSIEGTVLTVRPPRQGEPEHAIPDKVTQAASTAFTNLVQQSRGSIQKCYQGVLKKDSSIQARTITLIVSASFSSSGAYQQASFSPSLGEVFDTCMRNIAQKWTMPQNSPAMTFKAPVALTPS